MRSGPKAYGPEERLYWCQAGLSGVSRTADCDRVVAPSALDSQQALNSWQLLEWSVLTVETMQSAAAPPCANVVRCSLQPSATRTLLSRPTPLGLAAARPRLQVLTCPARSTRRRTMKLACSTEQSAWVLDVSVQDEVPGKCADCRHSLQELGVCANAGTDSGAQSASGRCALRARGRS